jgi:hypothetical protein
MIPTTCFTLVLRVCCRGPNPLEVQQCSLYEEFGVQMSDGNVEDYSRLLKITYSRPLGSCLHSLESVVVNYTVTVCLPVKHEHAKHCLGRRLGRSRKAHIRHDR